MHNKNNFTSIQFYSHTFDPVLSATMTTAIGENSVNFLIRKICELSQPQIQIKLNLINTRLRISKVV